MIIKEIVRVPPPPPENPKGKVTIEFTVPELEQLAELCYRRAGARHPLARQVRYAAEQALGHPVGDYEVRDSMVAS